MINNGYYNFLANNYAEKIHEKCHCNTFLTCVFTKNKDGLQIKDIVCVKCSKNFPDTLKHVSEKVEKYTRGLWRE